METLGWVFDEDKSGWGDGPWQTEPDKMQWTDAVTGLPCLIHRNGVGSLCGYVGVREGHPLFGIEYNTSSEPCPERILECGVTWSGRGEPIGEEGKGIFAQLAEGETQPWWFGFDCAHCFDICPSFETGIGRNGIYRDLDYVRSEVESLAQQLAALQVEPEHLEPEEK